MPGDDGRGPDDGERVGPARPNLGQARPECTVDWAKTRARSVVEESGELLTQRQILQHEVGAWLESGQQRAEGGDDEVPHGRSVWRIGAQR